MSRFTLFVVLLASAVGVGCEESADQSKCATGSARDGVGRCIEASDADRPEGDVSSGDVSTGETDLPDACDGCSIPAVVTLSTTSTSSQWSPREVVHSGEPLRWTVSGGLDLPTQTADTPVFDLSANPGTVQVTVESDNELGGLEELALQSLDIVTADLGAARDLVKIDLYESSMSTVDLSRNTRLDKIWIQESALTELDISANRQASYVALDGNALQSFDVSQNAELTRLRLQRNRLDTASLDKIVVDLAAHGNTDGELFLADNAGQLSSASYDAYQSLIDRGWTIDVAAPQPPSGCEPACTIVLDTKKAFPTAQGAGSITTGGRGGQVIHVTTLADSGPGSFREAMETPGPRTIVFDVSGRIELAERIELIDTHSDLTIAGETAPRGGITISGAPVLFSGGYNRPTRPTDNVIIRHVRFRNGSYTGVDDVFDHNGIVSGGTDRFIFDHLSFSFNDDQALALNAKWGPLQDGTIQRSIVSENATGFILGVHCPFPADRISVLQNLFVHQSHRTPNVSCDGRFDVVNNVVFNWMWRLTTVYDGSAKLNYVGNHLTTGDFYSNADANNKVQLDGPADQPRIFTANNYHNELYPTPQADDRGIWSDFSTREPVDDAYFTTTRHPLLAETEIMSAAAARAAVLDDVGANSFVDATGVQRRYLDTYDAERISDADNAVSRDPRNKSWTQPSLPNESRPADFYVSLPDIPEAFVRAHGITSNDDVIAVYDFGDFKVDNRAGYSAFEVYLFYAAGDWDRLQ